MGISLPEDLAERHSPSIGIPLDILKRALQAGEHALAIYIHIADKAQGTGRAILTTEQLCDLSDLSKNTVKKYIGILEDRGLIGIPQKGQWRGLPTVYTLANNCHYPSNIVNLFTEKGSNDERKGSNSEPDPWHEESDLYEKGSIPSMPVYVQGVNDSEERGQRQCTYSPTPPSSNYKDSTTLERGGTVDTAAPEWLLRTPEIQEVRKEYPRMTDALVLRSHRELQIKVFHKDPPRTPRAEAKRLAGWLRKGERSGLHNAWRREAPYEMGGVIPG